MNHKISISGQTEDVFNQKKREVQVDAREEFCLLS